MLSVSNDFLFSLFSAFRLGAFSFVFIGLPATSSTRYPYPLTIGDACEPEEEGLVLELARLHLKIICEFFC